jgi:hypothetical protein
MLESIARAVRRLVAWLGGLVPAPPLRDAEPPDVDGRRPEAPETTALELDILRKDGHGGYR